LAAPRSGAGITSASVEFGVTPAGLAAGSHTANVVLSSQYGGSQTVVVRLTIVRETDPPRLVLSVPEQRFSALVGGDSPEAQYVEISNAGGGTLTGIGLGTPSYQGGASGWLSSDLTGTTLRLRATTGSLAKGDYLARLPVTSTNGGSVTLDVKFVVGSPRLTVTPKQVSFADSVGGQGPAPGTVSYANTGGGDKGSLGPVAAQLVYAGEVTGWLTAAVDTSAATVTITASTGNLPAKVTPYQADVLLGSQHGGQDTISVLFTVAPGGAPPRLALSLDSLRFATLIGQDNPNPQDVTAFNAGGGDIGGLSIRDVDYEGAATGWLRTSIEGLQVSLSPDKTGLAAGLYHAKVTLASERGGDAALQVSLDIGQPVLRLSTRTITFSDTVGSREVLRSQVFITNTGSGTRADLGPVVLGTVSYSSGATGWLHTLPSPNDTVASFQAAIEAVAADVPEGTWVAKVPFRSRWGGTDTVTISLSARRPDRSFDLPTIELVRTVVQNGAPVVQRLPGDSVVVTATAHSAAQVGLRVGIRNGAETRLTLSGLRVGIPAYTVGKSGWISGAFLNRTSATFSDPAELFVAIEPATLDAGRYEARLVVRSESASLAGVASVTLRVILLVQ